MTTTLGMTYRLRHTCTVTRGFETASQNFPLLSFLSGHHDMTYLLFVLLSSLFFFFFSGISCGPCNNWHYLLGHIKHVDDDDDEPTNAPCRLMTTLACWAESVVLISCSQRPAASSTDTATVESFSVVNCTRYTTHHTISKQVSLAIYSRRRSRCQQLRWRRTTACEKF